MLTLGLRQRLMGVVTRFLPLCAGGLILTLIVPTKAFAEAIAVSPLLGPAGRSVTVYGTCWRGHGIRGLSVPIWIGFANEVARGHPDANGEFSVSFTIPPSTPQGTLTITAINGHGGGTDAYSPPSLPPIAEAIQCGDPNILCEHEKYALDPDPEINPLSGYGRTRHGAEFLAWKAFPSGTVGPEIVQVETFHEADLVFFRLFYTDPNKEIGGFGFVGINGSGWAEENHPFSSPSYGRVSPGRIEYPFNHLCESGPAYESDVEAWILDNTGQRRSSVTVHLARAAPREVVIGPDPH